MTGKFFQKLFFSLLSLVLIHSEQAGGQSEKNLFEQSDSLDIRRLHVINYTIAGLYPVSMTWLYTQWYRDYPQSAFHLFNDAGEWELMDKYAHAWDAYVIGKPLIKLYRWAGMNQKKSALAGAGVAYLYQTTIEVFDGFSSEWGFSLADVAANTVGTGLLLGQELLWNEQRVVLKFSFHQTKYAAWRPALLGSNLPENILKDYNGITCWMSINPRTFMPESSRFPRWLSFSLGVGAEGMTGGHGNPAMVDGIALPEFTRYRQYYFGIDFDLARVDFRSKFLNGFFSVINIIRLPAPAIEFNAGRKTKFYSLYF